MPLNQPPLNFPPPPKRVDFLGPLLKAAQLKFQQQQIEATNLFRKQQLGLQQQGVNIQQERLGIARTKAERPESLFAKPQIEDFTPESIRQFRISKNPADLIVKEKKTGTLFQKPAIEKFTPESIKRFRTTKNPADLVPRGKEGSTLEGARRAFLEGTASSEQLALIGQDRAEYVRDYLSVFQGTFLTPKKHANLRRQGEILFQIERLKANPLPANITTTSKAVEFLTSLGFDENQAREIVKQIMRNERASR